MSRDTMERAAPLAGVGFTALLVASFMIAGETPDREDSTAQVVAYWTENDGQQIMGAVLAGFASVFLVWFGSSLRGAILRAEGGDGRLAVIAFAGSVMAAVGALLFAGLSFAAADSVGDVPGEVTQTIGVLNEELFFPLAGGIALMMIASGLAFIRTRMLPVWLGWLTLVIGLAAMTPVGFFAFLATIAWVAAIGIVLYMRQSEPVAPAA